MIKKWDSSFFKNHQTDRKSWLDIGPDPWTRAGQAYNSTHSGFLAVLWALLLLRPSLKESRFTICTDRDSIRWILNNDGRNRKTRPLTIKFVWTRIWSLTLNSIKLQASIELSRLLKTGSDHVRALTISDDATSEDRLSVLTVPNAKYHWHTRPVDAYQNDASSLGWRDSGNIE